MTSPEGNLVGIDLGTTMSVVAHVDSTGRATTLTNREGDLLTPSVVYLDGNEAIVGKSAKAAAAHHPDKVASLFKRSMGAVLHGRMVDGRSLRPETLSAIVLRKLRNDAERRIAKAAAHGNRADQQKDQDDDEDGAKRHGCSPLGCLTEGKRQDCEMVP